TDANGCPNSDTLEVLEDQPANLSITGDDQLCAEASEQLVATTGFASYAWNTNETTPSIDITSGGTYTVTATEANGCVATASIEVTEVPALMPTVEGDLTICPGASTTLATTGFFTSVNWSNGTSGPSITVSEAGDYTVTVENSTGCTGSATVTVVEVPNPTPEIDGDFRLCTDEVSTLTTTQTYATYAWSNNSTESMLDVSEPGTYTVTVTNDEGCVGTASETVELIIPIVSITGDPDSCAGTTTVLSATEGFDDYAWSTGSSDVEVTVANVDQVSVTVTDADGCTATDSLALNEQTLPEVTIDGRLSFCPAGGTELMASTGLATYTWSNSESTSTIFINEAGNYAVTVTDANGCSNSASVDVVEEAELSPQIQGELQFCSGTSTELSVNSGYTVYDWSTGESGQTITVTESGDVTIMVADEFGCMGSETVTVTALALPTPDIDGTPNFCLGDSTELSSDAPYAAYAWSVAAETDNSLVVTAPGTYGLTVTDDNNCQGSTSIAVAELALPTPTIAGEPGFCPGLSTVLTAPDSLAAYAWSTGSAGPSISVSTSETIGLSVTDDNGCVGSTTLDVAPYTVASPSVIGDLTVCPGDTTTLSITEPFAAYNWSDGSTEPMLSTPAVGDVSVVVTDANNCETSATVNVNEFTVTAPDITAPLGFCEDASAELSATEGYATYEWTGGNTTSDLTVTTGGVYEVSVTDTNGCPSQAAVAISAFELPEPTIAGSLTFCTGTTTTLNAGADYATYQWSTGGGANEEVISTAGPVGLTVTDANGCVGNTSEQVEEATELSPVIAGEAAFCAGLSTELSAGNGFAIYNWSTGDTTATITVTEPGSYTLSVTDASGCSGDATVAVAENALPNPEITGELAYCADQQTELTASAGFAAYLWSTGAPTTSITVADPAVYSLTVIDENDCENSTSVTVAEQALPVFALEGPTEFCVDASTTLTVDQSFETYAWSTGATEQSIEVATGGTVGVTVTDEFGCQSATTESLTTVPLPLADAGPAQQFDCDTDVLSIGGTASSAGDNFTYIWTGPGITDANATAQFPAVDTTGTYTLVVTNTDFGCVSVPATVALEDLSYVPQIVLEVLDVLDCATSAVQIDARDSDLGDEVVFQWLDSDLNPLPNAEGLLITVNEAQFYTLSVLDTLTGCDNEDIIEVEENELYPVANAGEDLTINCYEPTGLLDGSNSQQGGQISYEWFDPTGQPLANQPANTLFVDSPGWYLLQVTDELNECFNVDSVLVTADFAPPVAAISDGLELDCTAPSTTLSAEGSSVGSNMAYTWLLNNNVITEEEELSLFVETPGDYAFQVLNTDNGCTDIANTLITLNPNAPEALDVLLDVPTCAGDADGSIAISELIGGTSPFLYSINGAALQSETVFSNLTGGTYTIQVEDAIGCILEAEVSLPDGNDLWVELDEYDPIPPDTTINIWPTLSVDSSALVDWTWNPLSVLPCGECLYQTDVALRESTRFFLDVTDENGCTASAETLIIVEKKRNVYIPSAFTPDEDGSNDIFYIFGDDTVQKIRSFLVFNRWGEPVFEVYNSPPNDPTYGWDGSYRDRPLNAAVFVWMAEIEFADGEVEVFSGYVVIVK
ncbi:MAG: gliding motility-associated C-terminal domain-containing protein, partial [Bacteroidota bacterium]